MLLMTSKHPNFAYLALLLHAASSSTPTPAPLKRSTFHRDCMLDMASVLVFPSEGRLKIMPFFYEGFGDLQPSNNIFVLHDANLRMARCIKPWRFTNLKNKCRSS